MCAARLVTREANENGDTAANGELIQFILDAGSVNRRSWAVERCWVEEIVRERKMLIGSCLPARRARDLWGCCSISKRKKEETDGFLLLFWTSRWGESLPPSSPKRRKNKSRPYKAHTTYDTPFPILFFYPSQPHLLLLPKGKKKKKKKKGYNFILFSFDYIRLESHYSRHQADIFFPSSSSYILLSLFVCLTSWCFRGCSLSLSPSLSIF